MPLKSKFFHSVELQVIFSAMDNTRIDSRYREISRLVKYTYKNATFQVKIKDVLKTNMMHRGITQSNLICPKLLTHPFEETTNN